MPQLARLIKNNYVLYENSFYIPGRILYRGVNSFDVIVNGFYRVEGGLKDVLIDGKSLERDVIYLSKGRHIVFIPDIQRKYWIRYDLENNKRDLKHG